jgi:hypothetical protein
MFGCLDWSHATETGNRSAFRDKRGIRSVLQTSDRVLWDATHTHTPVRGRFDCHALLDRCNLCVLIIRSNNPAQAGCGM